MTAFSSSALPVLIGSSALEEHHPGLLGRRPSDLDYLALPGTLNRVSEDMDIIDGTGIIDTYTFQGGVASLDEVYTLKVSHSPWVITVPLWYKHLRDIRTLSRAGAALIPELHDAAYAQWEQRKGAKNVNLNQDKEEFFTSGVRRAYEHDSVHASVAFHDEPMFNRILAPGASVRTSRSLFDALSETEKKQLVQEEVMVLSLERDIIPASLTGRTVSRELIYSSYTAQLRRLITELSKGWFPQWMICHYYEVDKVPGNYWRTFCESDKKVPLLTV